MNKQDLIERVAEATDIPKTKSSDAVECVLTSIKGALKKGDTVNLVGFGTFSVKKRAARSGRNPKTGEPIKIAARKVPAFKPGKALKDAVAK